MALISLMLLAVSHRKSSNALEEMASLLYMTDAVPSMSSAIRAILVLPHLKPESIRLKPKLMMVRVP